MVTREHDIRSRGCEWRHTFITRSLIVGLCLLFSAPVTASPNTPRDIGLAGSSLATARGLEAFGRNPAALGIPGTTWWELRVFSVSTGIGSNGLGVDDYRAYNGATLTDDDKDDILMAIPDEGWRVDGYADITAFSLRLGTFGVGFSGFGELRGNIDRELIELLLYGNEVDRIYESEFNEGEGFAAAEISLAHGFSLGALGGRPLHAGINLRLLRGLYYARLDEAEGSLVASYNGVTGTGQVLARTAQGGFGFAADWGTHYSLSPTHSLSVVVENLPGAIRWSQEPEEQSYTVAFENITAESYDDSLINDTDTSRDIDPFSSSLPTRVRIGFGRQDGQVNYSVAAGIGFADRLTVSTTPELAAGIEFFPLAFVPLRAGASIGGLHDFSVALGTGLYLGNIHFEIASRTIDGFWLTAGQGASLSLAGSLHF